MDIDLARKLVTLHDNADRALANLRNAKAMPNDDPRATELLSDAGDAYAESIRAIWAEQEKIVTAPESAASAPETPPEAPKAPNKGADASVTTEGPQKAADKAANG